MTPAFDIEWLAEQVKRLMLEVAAVRGLAQQQLNDKDKEIAELKQKLNGDSPHTDT